MDRISRIKQHLDITQKLIEESLHIAEEERRGLNEQTTILELVKSKSNELNANDRNDDLLKFKLDLLEIFGASVTQEPEILNTKQAVLEIQRSFVQQN